MRVLLTGMSGVGKSTVVHELRSRGYLAVDSDDDGYTEPTADGRHAWCIPSVRRLFNERRDELLFFAGCSDEQAQFHFDLTILLTAPEAVLLARLARRTTNPF